MAVMVGVMSYRKHPPYMLYCDSIITAWGLTTEQLTVTLTGHIAMVAISPSTLRLVAHGPGPFALREQQTNKHSF